MAALRGIRRWAREGSIASAAIVAWIASTGAQAVEPVTTTTAVVVGTTVGAGLPGGLTGLSPGAIGVYAWTFKGTTLAAASASGSVSLAPVGAALAVAAPYIAIAVGVIVIGYVGYRIYKHVQESKVPGPDSGSNVARNADTRPRGLPAASPPGPSAPGVGVSR